MPYIFIPPAGIGSDEELLLEERVAVVAVGVDTKMVHTSDICVSNGCPSRVTPVSYLQSHL